MRSNRRRSIFWVVAGLIAVLLLLSSTIAYYYSEILWFDELGFLSVLMTMIYSRAGVGLAAALLFGLALCGNLFFARGTIVQISEQVAEDETRRWFQPAIISKIIVAVSAIFGALAGVSFSTEWEAVLRFLHATPFGIEDPLFARDIGFYIFSLPFWNLLYSLVAFLLLFLLVIMGLIYFFAGSINFLGGRINVHPRARLHLAGLFAAYLGVKAWGYWLDAFDLLYSPRGVAFGAAYTDMYAQLPVYRIMMGLSLLAAAVTLWYIRARDIRWVYAALIIMIVGSVGLGSLYPAAIQSLVVNPNEISMERPYIEYNIEYTRKAYGLDEVREMPFAASPDLSWDEVDRNMETINNIRLWDHRPLLSSYDQLQTIRAYYDFSDVDVDRYEIDGKYQQVNLSAREIDYGKIPGAETWVNKRLQFTHGHGVAMSPVSKVSPRGHPVMYLEDIPIQSNVDLQVDNPAIYYGELTGDYVISNTHEPEFSYPDGDENVYVQYDGEGGVPLDGIMRRGMFALRFADYNILISQALHSESRMMFRRNIADRVKRVAPFLRLDGDPYVVVDEDTGRLKWIQDAYTHSTRYPYSEPWERQLNYIRNSVKIVVDAYEGDMTFYIFDEEDPMVQTYASIFPDLFESADEMSDTLRAHARHPQDLFDIQLDMYSVYHMEDPVVFYNKEDLWEIPVEHYAGQTQPMEPYYVMLDLPQVEGEQEFVQMMPFNPAGRDVLVSWMAARSDGENLGELVVYRMPRGRTVYGPRQIESLIDQDDEMSQLMTLWGQSGSTVIRGNMLAIPIEESILYVEPIFLQADGARVPQLRRVVAAFEDELAIGQDLEQTLQILFGKREAPDDIAPGEPGTQPELIEQAQQLFMQAQDALRAGNWSRYGMLMEQLEEVLSSLAGDVDVEPEIDNGGTE